MGRNKNEIETSKGKVGKRTFWTAPMFMAVIAIAAVVAIAFCVAVDPSPDNDDRQTLGAIDGEFIVGDLKYRVTGDTTAELTGYVVKPAGVLVIPPTIEHDGKEYKVTSIYNYPGAYALDGVFKDCNEITSVVFNNIETIGRMAFFSCIGLESIDFAGSNVKIIQDSAFNSCSNLKTVNFSGSQVTSIGSVAFRSTGITSLDFAGTEITDLGFGAFQRCPDLKTVSFEGSKFTTTGLSVFNTCTGLKSVSFENSELKVIAQHMFYNCSSLKYVHLGTTLMTVDNPAFDGCTIDIAFMPIDWQMGMTGILKPKMVLMHYDLPWIAARSDGTGGAILTTVKGAEATIPVPITGDSF
jgi:Leucine-rich repeat (LRR) protein